MEKNQILVFSDQENEKWTILSQNSKNEVILLEGDLQQTNERLFEEPLENQTLISRF